MTVSLALDSAAESMRRKLIVGHAYRLIRYHLANGESVTTAAAMGAAYISRKLPETLDAELVGIEAMLVGIAEDEVREMQRGWS